VSNLKLNFLYEDNHILVIDKPFGMLSQKDLTGDLDVLTLAKEIIKRRDNKPGNVFLGLVHRLDRPVGGTMLIAKTSKAASRLSDQFRKRGITKIYNAVVEGVLKAKTGSLSHCLEKDRKTNITRVVQKNEGGKEAKLNYKVMDAKQNKSQNKSLLEIELITGLSHQIRVQLSNIGHPIIGDKKYESNSLWEPGKIALFSRSLSFVHPTKKDTITLECKAPKNWPF